MRRILLLGSLIYGLVLLGMSTLRGGLIALALPLVVYVAVALFYGPGPLRLKVTRKLSSDRVTHGTPVEVELVITNQGGRLDELLIQDLVPRSLVPLEGISRTVVSLAPGETFEMGYTLAGRRASLEFGPVRVIASDQLGLLRRRETLNAPAHLLILPQVLRLRPVAIRPLRTHGYAGAVPARQGGSGVEFFGVREYQMGDPRRWINWRMSARHPRAIFTNEFEQERIADVGLILDARQRSDVRLQQDSLFEHAITATASLADMFLNAGNRVGMLVYGGFLDWTFPSYGKVQRERILRALARAETGDFFIFESLDYLPTRFFPAQSQLVLISPLSKDDLPTLFRLRARGYQLLVVSPDPVSFEAERLKSQRTNALAARLARLERELLLRKLLQAGIRSVDWPVDRPFDQTLHASLGRVPHSRALPALANVRPRREARAQGTCTRGGRS